MQTPFTDPRLDQIFDKLTSDERAWLTTILFRDPLKPIYKPAAVFYFIALTLVLLWPFDMFYAPSMSRYRAFADLPFGFVSLSPLYLRDFFSNIAVFVPFGFLLSGVFFGRRSGNSLSSLLVILCGFAFSFSVELLQFGSPIRHSSAIDLATNTFGTALGNLAHVGYLLLVRHGTIRVSRK